MASVKKVSKKSTEEVVSEIRVMLIANLPKNRISSEKLTEFISSSLKYLGRKKCTIVLFERYVDAMQKRDELFNRLLCNYFIVAAGYLGYLHIQFAPSR